jgi:hypothetical protein
MFDGHEQQVFENGLYCVMMLKQIKLQPTSPLFSFSSFNSTSLKCYYFIFNLQVLPEFLINFVSPSFLKLESVSIVSSSSILKG